MSGPQRPSGDSDARLNKGLIFVLAGPAGSGKTALMDRLREQEPNVYFCVTATTRAPRPGEQDGIDYFFLDEHEFLARIERLRRNGALRDALAELNAALRAGLIDVIGQPTLEGGFRVGVTGGVLGFAVVVAELDEIVVGVRGEAGRPFSFIVKAF